MIVIQIGLIILSIVMVWLEICAAQKITKNNTGIMANERFKNMIDTFKKDPYFDRKLLNNFINFWDKEDTKSAKRMRLLHWLLAAMWICNGLSIFWFQTILGTCILASIIIGLNIYDSVCCSEKMWKISDKMIDEIFEKRNQNIKSRLGKPTSPNNISNG